MTFFSPKADNIVGVNCETLVKSLENPDPRNFPEEILSVIGKTHIFQFYYNTSPKQGTIDFILYDILDIPDTRDTPMQIKDKPSGKNNFRYFLYINCHQLGFPYLLNTIHFFSQVQEQEKKYLKPLKQPYLNNNRQSTQLSTLRQQCQH